MGGLERAPKPPRARRAPGNPGRSSILRQATTRAGGAAAGGGHLIHLRELVAAGEAQQDVGGAGVDPALEPFGAALDRPGVAGLTGADHARRCRIVRLEEAVQPLLRGGGAGIEGQGDVGRTGDGVGRATRRARRLDDLGPVLAEELDAGAGGEPSVEPRGLAQRGGSAAADPDRRVASPVRLGLHGDVVQGEVRAAEAHAVLAPQGAADRERLEESPHAARERHAHGLEGGIVRLRRGDFLEAVRLLETALELSRSLELSLTQAGGTAALGLAYVYRGQVEAGLALLEEMREQRRVWLAEATWSRTGPTRRRVRRRAPSRRRGSGARWRPWPGRAGFSPARRRSSTIPRQ